MLAKGASCIASMVLLDSSLQLSLFLNPSFPLIFLLYSGVRAFHQFCTLLPTYMSLDAAGRHRCSLPRSTSSKIVQLPPFSAAFHPNCACTVLNMLTRRLLAAAAMAMPIFALAITRGATDSSELRCGSTANAGFMAPSKRLAEKEDDNPLLSLRSVAKINVDVHIHIVAESEDDAAGNLSVRCSLSPDLYIPGSLPPFIPTLFASLTYSRVTRVGRRRSRANQSSQLRLRTGRHILQLEKH